MGKKMVSRSPSNQVLSVIAARLKLLGDLARLQIVIALDDGDKSAAEIQLRCRLAPAVASRHLKALVGAGILTRRKQGKQIHYGIADPIVFELCDLVGRRIQSQLSAHIKLYDA